MPRQKILVVEDEADIAELIEYNLTREGYEVVTTHDGEAGLALATAGRFDLVLLDLMLPGMDGIEVCRQLKADRETRDMPVIMVTAKGEEGDIVLGLGMGADDYVPKPFGPKELVARVKAVLRRRSKPPSEDDDQRITHDGLEIDAERHRVRVDGETVELTATEFRLLHFLARRPGRVFTRDALLNRVIGEDVIVIDRNIDVHVRGIRKKLGRCRDLIETIRGVGYRFRDEE